MQKPSLARMVIAGVLPTANNGSDVCPAVVTRVWSERPDGSWLVNIKLLNDGPSNEWRTSIYLFETEAEARAHGITVSCFWPPRV